MIGIVLALLIVLWLLGYISPLYFAAIPNWELFKVNNQPITLWNLLIFLVITWAISILPTPMRQIAGVLLVLWVLSLLGILAISGLDNLLIIVIIIGIVLSLVI